MWRASLIAAAAGLLLGSQARAQDAPAWCARTNAPPTPESLAVGQVYVPAEFAQRKARELLASAQFLPVDADLGKALGVPTDFLTPHTYLARAGGFEQPFGDPGPGLDVYYDHGAGILQTNTHYRSVASDPQDWAVVVVTPGDVYTVRAYCVAED